MQEGGNETPSGRAFQRMKGETEGPLMQSLSTQLSTYRQLEVKPLGGAYSPTPRLKRRILANRACGEDAHEEDHSLQERSHPMVPLLREAK